MSEKGCLLSKSFNTLQISNQTESKELFTKNHIKASLHINQDKDGIIMKENIDIFHQREPTNTVTDSQSNLHAATERVVGSGPQVNFPSKSIIESISIILKNDNFIVNNSQTTDVALRISISDDGITYNDLFHDGSGGNTLVILPGHRSSDLGSFISINTIIPIISNYRYNDKLDKLMAISTGGFVTTDNIDDMELARSSGSEGNSDAVPRGTLYNDSDTDKKIDIQLVTIGAPDLLNGFALTIDGADRHPQGIYSKIRSRVSGEELDASDPEGGKFTALVTFTKLL